jgi:hypothetical protein
MTAPSTAPTSQSNRDSSWAPFFSICIPQYNRTAFLIAALKTFRQQTFQDFEVCISDDCSTDGGTLMLLGYLSGSGLKYAYVQNETNLRYDGNIRRSIAISQGRYIWLMGNDDGLSDPGILASAHREILRNAPVAVAISNYREAVGDQVYRRMHSTGIIGSGPAVAVDTFRRYSFVSGVIMDGPAARGLSTDRCDGTEMYQMYLGARLISGGGRLLSIDEIYVDKDLTVPGEMVDSYRLRPKLSLVAALEKPLPMSRLLEVVAAGAEPYHTGRQLDRNLTHAARQLYTFIYPYWAVEYRRVQSWRYALGVLLSVRPSRVTRGLKLSFGSQVALWTRYLAFGVSSLIVPISLFRAMRSRLYGLAKRLQPSG